MTFCNLPAHKPFLTGYELLYSNPFSQRLVPGWYQNTLLFALDIGEITDETVQADNVYIPISEFDEEGTPLTIEGQYYIFARIPTAREYNGLCRVVFVEVPLNYTPNSLRSQKDVQESGYNLLVSDLVLLLPVL